MDTKQIGWHKRQIAKYRTVLEKANDKICTMLNEMLCDSNFDLVREDVQYALDGNLRRGEHLLTGLIDVFEESAQRTDTK